jgi:hypothetical protein
MILRDNDDTVPVVDDDDVAGSRDVDGFVEHQVVARSRPHGDGRSGERPGTVHRAYP